MLARSHFCAEREREPHGREDDRAIIDREPRCEEQRLLERQLHHTRGVDALDLPLQRLAEAGGGWFERIAGVGCGSTVVLLFE